MVPNPCFCGCTLQKATKIWAIFEIIFAIIIGVSTISYNFWAAFAVDKTPNVILAAIYFNIIHFIIMITELTMAVILLLGSINKQYGKCGRYLLVSSIVLVLILLNLIYFLAFSGLSIFSLCTSICRIVEKIFGIWLSYAFIQELKAAGVGMFNPFLQNTQVQSFQVQYQLALQNSEVNFQSTVQTQNQHQQKQQKQSQEVVQVKQNPV